MKKSCICLLFAILFSAALDSQELRSKEYVLKPSNPMSAQVAKQIHWYDADDTLVKVEHIYTETYSAESGYVRQIDYYRDDIIYLFEMYSTDEHQARTSLSVRRDFVDEADAIVMVQLQLSDGSLWNLGADSQDLLENFDLVDFRQVLSLSDYDSGADYVYETPLYAFLSKISTSHALSKTDEQTTRLIAGWQKLHRFKNLTSIYKDIMEVTVDGVKCRFMLQSSLVDIVDYESALVYYYYIGGVDSIPTCLVLGFFEPKKAPETQAGGPSARQDSESVPRISMN